MYDIEKLKNILENYVWSIITKNLKLKAHIFDKINCHLRKYSIFMQSPFLFLDSDRSKELILYKDIFFSVITFFGSKIAAIFS